MRTTLCWFSAIRLILVSLFVWSMFVGPLLAHEAKPIGFATGQTDSTTPATSAIVTVKDVILTGGGYLHVACRARIKSFMSLSVTNEDEKGPMLDFNSQPDMVRPEAGIFWEGALAGGPPSLTDWSVPAETWIIWDLRLPKTLHMHTRISLSVQYTDVSPSEGPAFLLTASPAKRDVFTNMATTYGKIQSFPKPVQRPPATHVDIQYFIESPSDVVLNVLDEHFKIVGSQERRNRNGDDMFHWYLPMPGGKALPAGQYTALLKCFPRDSSRHELDQTIQFSVVGIAQPSH
jgi:hypothetical protein